MTKIFLEILVGISFREECVPFEFESYHLTLGGKGGVWSVENEECRKCGARKKI